MEPTHQPLAIQELNRRAGAAATVAMIHGQIAELAVKSTRDQKRYLGLLLRDLTGSFLLRIWSDHPLYKFCSELRQGDSIALEAEFTLNPPFGCEAKNWTIRFLNADEVSALVAGPPEVLQKQAEDYGYISAEVDRLLDPRLRLLSQRFLEEYGDRLKRSAGARHYHHARRGGLVEHVAQMFRAANALCAVYPSLHHDLLLAGVLFHDAGKMWENCYPKDSLSMSYDLRGELLGHISVGIELINRLWNRLRGTPEFIRSVAPDSESVRLHLMHLVASHHGEKQFGSPVEPKTPEAFALHFIDNLDAKLDVITSAYLTGNALGEQITERVRPLSTNIVRPLAEWKLPKKSSSGQDTDDNADSPGPLL
jgi:3'-5' exoribonuclease